MVALSGNFTATNALLLLADKRPALIQFDASHANALRAAAHKIGRPSIALAQAIQFETGLRQVDVIGEWVPDDDAEDAVTHNALKWQRGLQWSDISNGFLQVTSPFGEQTDLRLADHRMVSEELAAIKEREGELPKDGPMIRNEQTGLPYQAYRFRCLWRKAANEAGLPKNLKNSQ